MPEKKAVVVRLDSGLGNQLFQVAFGEWLRLRFAREIVFDASGLPRSGRAPIDAVLFGDCRVVAAATELGWRSLYWAGGKYNALALQLAQRLGVNRLKLLLVDDGNSAAPAPPPTRAPVWAVGYWQSTHFVDPTVLQVMDQRLQAVERARTGRNDVASADDEEHGIAVHLRWGDYKTDERNRRRHGVLGMGYFDAAIRELGSDRPITVFSESTEAADWFAASCGRRTVRYAGRRDAWEDFFGLSRCRRVVIANSSFSWWAAAHRSAGKSVVMPAKWFAQHERWGRNASRRLQRPGWVQVENDWL